MSRTPYVIPKDKAREILELAISVALDVRVDQLDCSISWARQPTDKNIEEVLEIGLSKSNTHYNFIYRDMSVITNSSEDYWDIGFSTIALKPDYFLWITLQPENGWEIVKKYNLQKH